jgi:hypothetical protein
MTLRAHLLLSLRMEEASRIPQGLLLLRHDSRATSPTASERCGMKTVILIDSCAGQSWSFR